MIKFKNEKLNKVLNFNCKLRTEIHQGKEEENFYNLSRVGYMSAKTFIDNRLLNKSWMIIGHENIKTLIFIEAIENSSFDEIDMNTEHTNQIYLDTILINILKIQLDTSNVQVQLNDFYDVIPPSFLKFKYEDENSKIQNLPQAKKIKLKRLGKCSNYSDEKIKKYFKCYSVESKEDLVISSNQIFQICEMENLSLDVLFGIYTNKNDIFYYQIIDIEYEHYDSLRSLIKIENSNTLSTFSTVKEKSHLNILDAFVVSGRRILSKIERDVEIEIVKNDFNYPVLLPIKILSTLNNFYLNKYTHGKYQEAFHQINQSELYPPTNLNYFVTLYDRINSNFSFNPVVFLISPIHIGINYILRKISDENGFHYFTKDMNKFKSIENFIEYLKKFEFRAPSVINFKNAKRFSEFISDKIKSGGSNYIEEIKSILYFSRGNKNLQIFYYFSFENSTEIDNSLKGLPGNTIEYTLPDLNTRIEVIKIVMNNIINNYKFMFNKSFVEIAIDKMVPTESLHQEITSLNLYNISRLLVGFNLKEIKTFLKFCFEDYIKKNKQVLKKMKSNVIYHNRIETDSKEYIPFDLELIRQNYNKIKKSRLKSEKSISSIPEIKWENVGGLEHAKEDINDTIQLPIKYPRLFKNSLKRRSGLLLYGPPGSGKTLLAKAIANECSMNFISVKGPELLNMYVGESEKNIREVFERGRAYKPCVLFFDEIDALAPARAKNSDQNNVMDRIVAQFMTEMDGLIKADDLILIASTNRPDLIDPSLLRPGRFDKMIYVGLPKTVEEKIKIFQAQTNKLKLSEDVDLVKISEDSPEDYSGADIFAVCSKAFTLALKEKIRGSNVKKEDIVVNMNHFREAIKQIQPSLPKSEIMKYEELKLKYSNEN